MNKVETKKAIEYCISGKVENCVKCPLFDEDMCQKTLLTNALKIINAQEKSGNIFSIFKKKENGHE